jgi:hypothetical protein
MWLLESYDFPNVVRYQCLGITMSASIRPLRILVTLPLWSTKDLIKKNQLLSLWRGKFPGQRRSLQHKYRRCGNVIPGLGLSHNSEGGDRWVWSNGAMITRNQPNSCANTATSTRILTRSYPRLIKRPCRDKSALNNPNYGTAKLWSVEFI